jgi:hypothetical protein
MAHKEQMDFFSSVFDAYRKFMLSPDFKGVIDLGSHELSGGPHQLLPKSIRYVGVDLCAGKNVDVVSPIELVDLPSASFSIAISSEVLEHNPFWRETLFQLCRLSAPGGLVIWSCAGIGRAEHGTLRSDGGSTAPFVVQMGREYYRNISAYEAKSSFNHDIWFVRWQYFENFESRDTYFVGLRLGAPREQIDIFEILVNNLKQIYITKKTLRGYLHLKRSEISLCLYFRLLQVRKRILRFLREKNKFKKIVRRLPVK